MENVVQKKSWLFKISVLSVSLLCMGAAAVSATIPLMAKTLSDVSVASIEMITSIPNFGIIIFVFLSPFIAKLIGDKKTTLLGLILTLVAGIYPMFSENYTAILISRFLLGCGIGLFNSFAYSLIGYYFEGEERAKMMGYQAATSSIGSTVISLLVGVLIKYGWHASYGVYAITIISIVLFGIFVPETKHEIKSQSGTDKISDEKTNISPMVALYTVYLFFIYIGFMTVIYKLATLMVSIGYGSAAEASTISGGITIVGFIAGTVFGKVHKKLKLFTLPISVALTGIGIYIVGASTSIIITIIGALILGFFFGCITPYFFYRATLYSNDASQTLSSSLMIIGINLGCFMNPYIIAFVSNLFGTTSITFPVKFAGIFIIALGVINMLVIKKENHQVGENNEIGGF